MVYSRDVGVIRPSYPSRMLHNMAKHGRNKRRRTLQESTSSIHINDLPVGFLVDVAEYLSNPSKALLAVALSAHRHLRGC